MLRKKRFLSVLLSVLLVLGSIPVTAMAETTESEEIGLCEHHPQHTAECGYIEAQEEIPCNMGCADTDGDGTVDHAKGCTYQPAVEGQPCTYVCEICNPQDSGEEEDAGTEEEPATPGRAINSAVTDVQKLIDALPTATELEGMSAEERNNVYMQAQNAADAYDALEAEQQEQVDDTKLIEVFGYFNNQTAEQPSDAVTVTIDGNSQGYTDINSAFEAAEGHAAIIELGMDVRSSSAIEINHADTDITFKGGDYTLSGRIIVTNGSFTLESGSIYYWAYTDEAVAVNGGTVIVNGGSIDGSPEAIQVDSGKLIINSGTFTGLRVLQLQGGETLIKGGTFTASSHDTVACVNDGSKNVIVTIEGGYFFTNSRDASSAALSAILVQPVIRGGTFKGRDGGPSDPLRLMYAFYNDVSDVFGGGNTKHYAFYKGESAETGEPIPLEQIDLSKIISAGDGVPITIAECTKHSFSDNNDGTHSGSCLYCNAQATAEQHTLSYTVSSNVITETCSNCNHAATATLALTKQDDIYYTGSAITPVAVIYSDGWCGNKTAQITYQNNVEAGMATASLTIGGASASLQFEIKKATPQYTTPTNLTAMAGQTLGDVTLPTADNGTWSWKDAESTPVGNAGDNQFTAVFTPTNSNYSIVEVTVTIHVNLIQLTAPATVSWSGSTATWNSVENASGYSVQLYKDGSAQGSPVTTSGTSYDFKITEAGSYTFTVTATGSGAYSDSSESSQSTALHTVSFDTNGGTGTIPMQLVPNGGTTTEPTAPTRTGHDFDGWYSDSTFAEDSKWIFDTSTVTAPVILYAKWTASTYKVTLETNGGTVNNGNVTEYTYGQGATLPANVTREGYAFAGWYEDSKFTGNAVTAIGATETGDKTYYAKWLSVNASITSVSVSGTTGTINGSQISVVLPAATESLPTNSSEVSITPADSNATVSIPVNADNGSTWTFTVTAEDGETTATYTMTVAIQISGTVAISGTPVCGQALTATYEGNAGSVTWQWYRDGEVISDATGATYTLTVEDVGAIITVSAIAGDKNHTGSVTSEPTTAVGPTYTVTIPEKVDLGGTVTISASGVNVASGRQLEVAITGTSGDNDAFTLTSQEGAVISYTVTAGNDPVSLNSTVLTVNGGEANAKGETSLTFVKPSEADIPFSGTYTGTMTFTIRTREVSGL